MPFPSFDQSEFVYIWPRPSQLINVGFRCMLHGPHKTRIVFEGLLNIWYPSLLASASRGKQTESHHEMAPREYKCIVIVLAIAFIHVSVRRQQLTTKGSCCPKKIRGVRRFQLSVYNRDSQSFKKNCQSPHSAAVECVLLVMLGIPYIFQFERITFNRGCHFYGGSNLLILLLGCICRLSFLFACLEYQKYPSADLIVTLNYHLTYGGYQVAQIRLSYVNRVTITEVSDVYSFAVQPIRQHSHS